MFNLQSVSLLYYLFENCDHVYIKHPTTLFSSYLRIRQLLSVYLITFLSIYLPTNLSLVYHTYLSGLYLSSNFLFACLFHLSIYIQGWIKNLAIFWHMLVCGTYITWPKQFKPWKVLTVLGRWCTDILHIASLFVWFENRTKECAMYTLSEVIK